MVFVTGPHVNGNIGLLSRIAVISFHFVVMFILNVIISLSFHSCTPLFRQTKKDGLRALKDASFILLMNHYEKPSITEISFPEFQREIILRGSMPLSVRQPQLKSKSF